MVDTSTEIQSCTPSLPQIQHRKGTLNFKCDHSGSTSVNYISRNSSTEYDPHAIQEFVTTKPMIHVTTVPSLSAHHSSSIPSMSSTVGASYDGSSGRSFPLVTAKWIKEYPEEVQQAKDAEENAGDNENESIIEDYNSNQDGLVVNPCSESSEDGNRDRDTRNGDSKLGKLLEKTGEKLGSDRLAEKGRRKRAGAPSA